jgi:RNA polymerase sigma-70 factor (ECF subfamily)
MFRCIDYKIVGREPKQEELYRTAVLEFGRALDRLAAGYEADAEKRPDLRQEIHLQLWKSFACFDGRCSMKTWTFRVAHNTAVSHINRERRMHARFVNLEAVELERTAAGQTDEPDIDRHRMLDQISRLILQLKPLDREIIICYLEGMDAATIAEITGVSPSNVATKIHRIKIVLSRRFLGEEHHA